MIRAKVTVQHKIVYTGYAKDGVPQRGHETVVMTPVCDDSIPENQRFAAATPSGELKLTMKPDVSDRFELGKQFYVNFTEVAS